MEFLEFFTNYKQDHRLQNVIKFDLLIWPTFEIINNFSTHNVYWDTLYIEKLPEITLNPKRAGLFGPISRPGGADSAPLRSRKLIDEISSM